MEIKGIRESCRSLNTAALSGYSRMMQRTEAAQAEKSTGAQDTVTLSADASFKSFLATEVRKFSAAGETEGASAERIASLRQQYAGDSCPVSGTDVAAAMLNSVFGRF